VGCRARVKKLKGSCGRVVFEARFFKADLAQVLIQAAGQVILVRDRKEQARLKKALVTELVFTIQEAKGLEFETVLLWKFSADPKAVPLWRRVRAGGELERGRQPHLRHEINLLYAALFFGFLHPLLETNSQTNGCKISLQQGHTKKIDSRYACL
jgi:hypothetical protein